MADAVSEVLLNDFVEFINGGAWSSDEYTERKECLKVVRVSDIDGEKIDLSKCKYLPKDMLHKYSKNVLHRDDVIIATVGSHPTQPASVVGRSAIITRLIDGALLNQNAVCLRSKSPQLNQKYLGYLSKSPQFKEYIISHARGSANQVRMSIELLKKMPFELYPTQNQNKIVSILQGYDSLIEINQRRIEILEQIAKLIYDEWFEKFRYPGHESVKMIDSEVGEIPEDWQVKKLNDYIEFKRGTEPGSKNYFEKNNEGFIKFIRVGDLGSRDSGIFIENELAEDCVVTPKDILISMDGSVGIVKIGISGCISSGIRKIIFKKKLPNSFVYFLLKSQTIQEIISAHAKGTTILHAASSMEYMRFVAPPNDILSKFEDVADRILENILLLEKKNQNLLASRNLLLPKLISGELDVSELDIKVSEVEV